MTVITTAATNANRVVDPRLVARCFKSKTPSSASELSPVTAVTDKDHGALERNRLKSLLPGNDVG